MIDSLLASTRRFFERRRDRMHGGRAFAVALVATVLLTAATGGFLWLMAQEMTGTTEIENPDRPPEQMCDTFGAAEMETPASCAQPETITVEIGDLFWDVASGQIPMVFVGLLLVWLLLGIALHVLAGGYSGAGSFGGTLEVVAWSLFVDVLAAVIGVGLLWLGFKQVDLAVSDPDLLVSRMKRVTSTTPGLLARLVQFAAVAVQVGVWTVGLSVVHRVDRGTASVGAGIVGAALLVLTLL